MEIKKHDYGDGSGLRPFYYDDATRTAHRLCAFGNRFAMPALKALNLELSLENILKQIEDYNFAINAYAYGIIESFERTMNDVECDTLSKRFKHEAEEKLSSIYRVGEKQKFVGKHGAYIQLSNGTLTVDAEAIKRDFTKHLESDKEKEIWEMLCGVCDIVNTLFSDNVKSNWVEEFFKIQNGTLVPITPIWEKDFIR